MSFLINSYRFATGGGGTDYPSGAKFAYGLREMPGFSYTGPLVRVRRSSDNVEMDFYQGASAGDLNTTRGGGGTSLASFLSTNSGYVVTWYDQSGSGNNGTQSNVGLQGIIYSSGTAVTVNSKPAITFSGSRYDTGQGLFNSVQYYFCIAVVQATGAGGSSVPTIHTAYTSGGYKCATVYDFSTSQRYQVGGRKSSGDSFTSVIGTTNEINNQVLITGALDYSAGTAKIYKNGSLDNTNSSFLTGTTDATSNGSFNDNIGGYNAANNDFAGKFQEIAAYGTNISSNLSDAHTSINSYFSIY